MNDKISKETSHNDLYFTYRNSIAELFNSAESHDIAQFFLSLMPPPRELAIPAGGMLWEVPDMEIEEAIETHRRLSKAAVDEHIDPRTRTKLMLFVSFHLLEADRWHAILGNVLNAIIGRNYVGNLFENDPLGEKINRIRGLLKACRKSGVVLSVAKTYPDVCNDQVRELRNAFFHSHYTLTPGGHLLITKGLMEKQRGSKNYFQIDEIRDIHQRAVTFLTVIAETRKERLRKLQDRQVNLDHEIDWIKTAYSPPTKLPETRYRLTGKFRYLQDDRKWRFRGRLHTRRGG